MVMNSKRALKICTEISLKRWEMMEMARKYGMSHDHTLRSSEELDKLINEYLILKHHSIIEMRDKKEGMFVIEQKPFYQDFSL